MTLSPGFYIKIKNKGRVYLPLIKGAVTFGKTEKVREQIKNLICVAKNANETVIC